MRRTVILPFTAATVVAALLTVSGRAHADPFIGVDADGALPVNANNLVNGGGGFGIRAGEQIHVPLLRVAGEIGYGYEHLFAEEATSDWTTNRVFAGARLAIGELVTPFAFAHVGYGWRNTSDNSYGGGGVAFDGGLGLDINLGIVAFGGHVGYAFINAQPVTPQWVILGLDATIVF